jgi:hypothetical protein
LRRDPNAVVAKPAVYTLAAEGEVELQWQPCTLDVASFTSPVEERS